MTKQEAESRCLNLTIKNCSQLKDYTLIDRTHRPDKGERPDFILESKDNSTKIGIEHFLVDTLLKEQGDKKGSKNRMFDAEMLKIYNKYAKEKIRGNETKALKEIGTLINKEHSAVNEFSCETFQMEFWRIITEHCKSIDVYRSKGIDKLGFLCEINVMTTDNVWEVLQNGKWHKQAINIPITKAMAMLIKILLLFEWIDFFIITLIPTCTPQKSKSIYITKGMNIYSIDAFRYVNQDVKLECSLKLENDK